MPVGSDITVSEKGHVPQFLQHLNLEERSRNLGERSRAEPRASQPEPGWGAGKGKDQKIQASLIRRMLCQLR